MIEFLVGLLFTMFIIQDTGDLIIGSREKKLHEEVAAIIEDSAY